MFLLFNCLGNLDNYRKSVLDTRCRFFSTTKFRKYFSPRCIFSGLLCKCAKMQVIRRVRYSLICEILTKTKFEFFLLNLVKFRSLVLEMLNTKRGRTDGQTVNPQVAKPIRAASLDVIQRVRHVIYIPIL